MLIFVILVIDLVLVFIAVNFQSLLHYKRIPYFDLLLFILLGTWTVTYIFFIDSGFFEIRDIVGRTKDLFRKFFVFVLLTSITLILFNLDEISRTMSLGSCLIFLGLKYPATYLYAYLISTRKDSPSNNRILVVGAGKVGLAIEKYYKMSPTSGMVIGFLDDTKERTDKVKVLGKLDDFQAVYNSAPFNEVVITLSLLQEKKIRKLVNLAEYNGVRPSVVANYYSLFHRNFELRNLAGIPTVNIREFPMDSYIARFWKRVFDVAFSFVALLMAAPLLILIAVAIKLDSRGPVFYKPIRLGKRGAKIYIYKFRSMRHSDKPTDQTSSTKVNDDRITRVGRFIRKYSLDELPQFLNVFLGDMSVVGPRPHRIDLNKRFQQTAQNYLVRHYVKPGITGWAQVNGWRGPTETRHQYIARTLHDLWYIEHWNFALDIYIIILTIFGKHTRKNAF
jgi:putative colanic acid biosysnthesis UDP-glucose lipid carrier transferase